MKIQQIRNATIRIECAGKHFLIDPWFQKKGTGMSAPSPDPEKAKIPSPTTELPFPVEQIMEGIDAMIVTHIHPDHFDPETAAMLDKNIPVFAANEETKSKKRRLEKHDERTSKLFQFSYFNNSLGNNNNKTGKFTSQLVP